MQPSFKRILFGVPQGSTNKAGALFAAELARLLGLELFGLFIEDISSSALGELPFAREFLTLERRWSPMDPVRLAEQSELAVRRASRQFSEAVRALWPNAVCQIVKDEPARAVAAAARPGDIVILSEPLHLGGMILQEFDQLMDVALETMASVFLVPNPVLPQQGPVIAIAGRSDEASIQAGLTIAFAARTELIIVDVGETGIENADIDEAGLGGVPIRIARSNISAITGGILPAAGFTQAKERIIVISRETIGRSDARAIASLRKVPVLIANPG